MNRTASARAPARAHRGRPHVRTRRGLAIAPLAALAALLAGATLARADIPTAPTPPPGAPPPTATPPATTPVPPGGATPLAPSSPNAVNATRVERRTPGAQGMRARGFNSIFAAPYSPRFSGPWLFDRAVRDALVAPTLPGQRTVSTISDGLLFVSFLAPLSVSAAYALGGGSSLGEFSEMAAVDVGAQALDLGITEVFKYTFGRERPYATAAHLSRYCDDPAHERELACGVDRNASFLSGHSSTAFTSAGLVCAQAAAFGHGADAWDGVACGIAIAGATTTAMLRMISDRHYSTDTLAGTALGLAMGLVLPTLLFLSPIAPFPVGGSLRTPAEQFSLLPTAIGAAAGVVAGTGGAWLLAVGLQGRRDRLAVRDLRVGPVAANAAFAFGVRGQF